MVIVTVESDLDGFVLRAQQAEEYHLYVNQLTDVGHITSWTAGCCEFSTNIKVRNCGSYYVYYLNGIPTCYGRYYGTY